MSKTKIKNILILLELFEFIPIIYEKNIIPNMVLTKYHNSAWLKKERWMPHAVHYHGIATIKDAELHLGKGHHNRLIWKIEITEKSCFVLFCPAPLFPEQMKQLITCFSAVAFIQTRVLQFNVVLKSYHVYSKQDNLFVAFSLLSHFHILIQWSIPAVLNVKSMAAH